MIAAGYLKKLHLFISADFRDAIFGNIQDRVYLNLLFFIVLCVIGGLFLTKGSESHLVIIYLIVPVLLIPVKFEYNNNHDRNKLYFTYKFSFYNIARNIVICRSPLFAAVVIYGLVKVFLSYLHPESDLGYFQIFFYFLLLPLMAFIIAVMRLCVDMRGFYFSFFKYIAPIVAFNATVNLYLASFSYPDFYLLITARPPSSFGSAMGYNSNLDELIYSVYLVGAIITFIQNRTSIKNLSLVFSILILSTIIIIEQGRGPAVALFASLSLYLFLSRKKINIYHVCFFIISMGIFLICTKYVSGGLSNLIMKFDNLRFEIWLNFFNLRKHNMLDGYGDRFVFLVPLSNGELAPHPHSILLSSFVRGGVVGLISLLFIIISGLLRSCKYGKRRNNYLPFCIFTLVIIAGLFDFEIKIWQSGWYLAGYWLSIAFVLGADASLRDDDRRIRMAKYVSEI